ncbi:MAG TPA: hypothetical protein VMU35_07070 [Methylomirabilota bacterium]|nr:hypothetical protein [Methylomirabilota bacterium]
MKPEAQLFFKLCSDHLSIEAIPKSNMKLDLSKIKRGLEDDLVITIWTPHFVVIRNVRGIMITLRKDGRMIVRNSDSEAEAKAAAIRVLSTVSQL